MTEPNQKQHFILNDELATAVGLKCSDCQSRKPVYAITKPYPPHIPAGVYCYKCLLQRCISARACPYPIPEPLLDKLKYDIKAFYRGLRKYH